MQSYPLACLPANRCVLNYVIGDVYCIATCFDEILDDFRVLDQDGHVKGATATDALSRH